MGQSESTSSRYESSKVMPPVAPTDSTTPTQKHMLVAAISFGDTFSGYAFSYTADFNRDPLSVQTKLWTGPFRFDYKVPTQVLIEKNGKTFKAKAFGYDAETEYVSANDEEKTRLFLFKRFMMSLDIKCGLNKYVAVEDALGKLLPAITVFSLSIVWLKNDVEKMLNKLTGRQEYKPSEILWVFTVPAIWNDDAKQFMREAATQAGISNDQLEVVSEPEAASVFFRHQTTRNFVGQYANLSDLKEGEQYMVLNAGGDSVDFTIHEVVNSRAVNEVRVVSCGCMGGENVDNKLLAFLEEITDLNTVVRERSPQRQFQRPDDSDVLPELHIFVDASSNASINASINAYGATANICNKNESTLIIADNSEKQSCSSPQFPSTSKTRQQPGDIT